MSALPASMLNLSIAEFLERAGAREPVPGGGSVAALVGALAAAMGQMTARYTVGNARYAEHEPAVRAWLDELARTREAFCRLLAEDVAAYGRYSAAARNKGDDEQAVVERSRALATATAVPMEIVAVAAVAAERMDAMKACCNRHLLSDLVVGAVLCDAAAHAAAANARINLAAFDDAAEAERLASDLRGMLQRVRAHRDSVEAFVVG
ncbi:MAG: cyclodeaminase/cyclohydrolase family protein [Phycisphaerae bacterium]|nr:cyclodeaminase/cyclohydrolase family protein [Phycisphaerae bacterium]